MRFSLALPVDRVDALDEFVTSEAIFDMASAAERAGFHAVFVSDHPAPPHYWLEAGGHHDLDPFVALSFAATATATLRLHTNLCVVPYRNPFLLAKSVASLDQLSSGRLELGVGAGYLEPEFDALGADFDQRGEILEESLLVMKEIWRGERITKEGHGFSARDIESLPRPAQRPRPRIWVGGNSRRAIRCAVEQADGWSPMPATPEVGSRVHTPALVSLDDLRSRLGYAHRYAEEVGRIAPLDILFLPISCGAYGRAGFSTQRLFDEVEGQAAIGVTHMAITLQRLGPAGSGLLKDRTRFLELVERFGAEVIGPLTPRFTD